jgi:hypothetical protein
MSELIDPRNTSQMCSVCGEIVKKDLSKITSCSYCGLILDRDLNAALIFLDWNYNLFVKPIDAPNFSEGSSHHVYTSTEYWLYENFSIISPKVSSSCSPEIMSLRVSFPTPSSFSPTMIT